MRTIHSCFRFMFCVVCLFILIAPVHGEFESEGVDLLGRSPYGYCPFVVANGEYLYSANGTVLQVLDIHSLQPVGEWVGESIVSSLAVSQGYLFIANWSDGFKVIDVNDPANPQLAAEIEFPGQCWDLSISGDFVYLGNSEEGLRIIDISQPTAPLHIATFQPPEMPLFEYTEVIDTLAYAATQSGLYILDVSDPTLPEELGYSPAENGAWSVHVIDSIAYLPKGSDGIRMVNVADPTNPVELGYCQTPDAALWIDIRDTLAYVAERWSGIQILDISDLTAPDSIGMIEMDYADAIHFQGDSMYVAASSWGVKAFDMSDPLTPVLLHENPMGGYSLDVVLSGDYVYAAYRGVGIRAFQWVGDDLVQVGQVALESPNKLSIRGDLLFATDAGNLQIIDITDPSNMQILNTWEDGAVSGVTSSRYNLYLTGFPDLQILDIRDPFDIQLVGSLDGLPSSAYEVTVNRVFAFLANRSGGMQIIDIREPTNPQHVGTFDNVSYCWGVDVTGKYAYLADRGTNEIRAVDISDPEMPVEAGIYSNFSRIEAVKAFGRYVYALDAWEGVRVIDFGDPMNPQEVGYFDTGGFARGLSLDNGAMAVADGGGGLYLLDTGLNAPTFMVNSTGDANDMNPGDGICDTGNGDCTLRAALQEANAYPGYNIINFDIPGDGPHHIQPMTALPAITDPVDINGRSEPDWAGAPVISINGDNAGGEANGLKLTPGAAQSRIMGLNISGYSMAGIRMESHANGVIYCTLGLDVSGSSSHPNDFGIEVYSSYNRIIANSISGNASSGINLVHNPGEDYMCHHNLLLRNNIGTDVAASFAIPNNTGISVEASSNVISGNTISGNLGNGIDLFGSDNQVIGNVIGLDVSGTQPIGNGNAGVMLLGPYNEIGGDWPEARNFISGNLEGITFSGPEAHNNLVQGNFIGTDMSGTSAVGNGMGLLVLSPNNVIGGQTLGAGNLISGNGWAGIGIGHESIDDDTDGNIIAGNLIGTDVSGTMAIPNDNGVTITNSDANIIGLVDNDTGFSNPNVISGNLYQAVRIGALADYNIVQGNFLGTDISGTQPLGNGRYGVRVTQGGSYTLIGGLEEGQGNVISANASGGVGLGWSGGASFNIVQGNLIGTDVNYELELGNGVSGVAIFGGAENNLVGGMEDGAENVIIHNQYAGVSVNGSGTELNNSILRNTIYGNGEIGIDLSSNSSFPYTDGVTENDPGDSDEGPNHYQNFPERLNVGIETNGNLTVQYLVDSDPGSAAYPLRVLLFVSDEDGEGNRWILEDFYSAADYESGLKTMEFGPAAELDLGIGQSIVATATDAEGNTSEFSHIATVSNYVGVADHEILPSVYSLQQNYPNPFNPTTTIRYGLPERVDVALVIYDIKGRAVYSHVEEDRPAGWVTTVWDGTNNRGESVSTGVFFCRLVAGEFTKTIKMVYMK